jgi:hypothetical protein
MPRLRRSLSRRLAGGVLSLAAAALLAAAAPAPAAHATGSASGDRAELRLAHAEACRWARIRADAPKAQPFLQRLVAACDVVEAGGYLGDQRTLRTTGPVARIAVDFVAALQRATRGLERLYMNLWEERLKHPSPGVTVVEVTDTSVFLAFQHERTFRHADKLLRAHDLAYSTATLDGAAPGRE